MALDHYRYQRIIPNDNKAEQVSDMVEFLHQSITTSLVTPEGRIIHGINMLTCALIDAPTNKYYD